jgi:hypothetical protein
MTDVVTDEFVRTLAQPNQRLHVCSDPDARLRVRNKQLHNERHVLWAGLACVAKDDSKV